MKIALIVPKSTFLESSMVWQYLGLAYIGARLESWGHEVAHYDLNVEKLPNDGVYDYFFITSTSPQIAEARNIAQITTGWKTKRVIGGSMAWTNSDSCKDLGYDLTVSGEADEPNSLQLVLDILQNYPDQKLLKLPTSKTLDWSMPPSRKWSYKYNAGLKDKISSELLRMDSGYFTRGCSFSCSFCEVGRLGGLYNKVRYEPLDVIEYQLKEIKNMGYDAIGIYDDTILIHKQRLLLIMDLLEKHDLRWRCFLRSDLLEKHGGKDFLRLMRNKGLREIFLGVESGSNRIKDNIYKGTTINQDTNVVQWCKELNVVCKTSFIIGLPGENLGSINETRKWILDNRPDRVQIGILIPLYGTPLYSRPELFDLKYEKQPDEKFFYSGKFEETTSFVSTSFMTKEDIDREYKSLYLELKNKGINLS